MSLEELSDENVFQSCLFGNILALKFVMDKNVSGNVKKKKFCADIVPLKPDEKEERHIEALASWYTCQSDGVLQPIEGKNNFFVGLDNYIATINNFNAHSSKMSIPSENLADVKSSLVKYFY